MEQEWITVQEAATLSGYHPEHIRRLIRGGEVEARKFSVVWAVNRDSLLDYLKSRQKESSLDPKN